MLWNRFHLLIGVRERDPAPRLMGRARPLPNSPLPPGTNCVILRSEPLFLPTKEESSILHIDLTNAGVQPEAFVQGLTQAHGWLQNATGKGNDFVGWVNLPRDYDKD